MFHVRIVQKISLAPTVYFGIKKYNLPYDNSGEKPMTYIDWFESHGKKHQNILKKLEHLSDEEVIIYFRFENMLEKEPDFCYLYDKRKKCHEMEVLNCYLCACPEFRFKDEGFFEKGGKTLYSSCAIESKYGSEFVSDKAIHQDCSACTVPHHESYIRKHFSRDWFEVMQNVKQNQV